MSAIDFLERDPKIISVCHLRLKNNMYTSISLPTHLSKNDINELIKLVRDNTVISKIFRIDFNFTGSIGVINNVIEYMCTGKLKDEFYLLCGGNGTVARMRRNLSPLITNAKLPMLKRIVEKRPELLYAPGSTDSSKLLVTILGYHQRSSFSRIVDTLTYLRSKGYIVTQIEHITGSPRIGTEMTINALHFYGFPNQVTPPMVTSAINSRGRYYRSVSLAKLWERGFDKDMRIQSRTINTRRLSSKLPNNWKTVSPTVNLVEYALLVYKAGTMSHIINVIKFLKKIGVNHQNNSFTNALLDRCISMSKKRYPKHDTLVDAVRAFDDVAAGGATLAQAEDEESSSSFSSSSCS